MTEQALTLEVAAQQLSAAVERACFEAFKRGQQALDYSLDTPHRKTLDELVSNPGVNVASKRSSHLKM